MSNPDPKEALGRNRRQLPRQSEAMLPTGITRRVETYKQHTDYAVLAIYEVTAAAHFKPPSGAEYTIKRVGSLIGKEKYLMPIAEFRDRIDFILKPHGSFLTLPPSVSRSLATAAKLRDEVTDLLTQRGFAERSTSRDQDADRKHRWFSGYLRETNSRLDDAGIFHGQDSATKHSSTRPAGRKALETQNPFSALSIEDADTDMEDATTGSRPQVELMPPSAGDDCKPEIADDFIRATTVFNEFLHDLDTMRQECRSAWTRALNKKLDMCAAGLVANTAICFARNTEERISECLARFGGISAFWEAHYQRSISCKSSGDSVEVEERRQVIAAYDRLLENGCAVFHHSRVIHARIHTDTGVTDFQRLYETTINPVSRSTAIAARVRYAQDQSFLLQLEREISFMAKFRTLMETTCLGPHVVDELLHYHIQKSKGVQNTRPLWADFARQIYLDIAHLYGEEIHRPFHELQAFCSAILGPIQRLQHRWQDEAAKEDREPVLPPYDALSTVFQIDLILRDSTLGLKSDFRHPICQNGRAVKIRTPRQRYVLNGPDRAQYCKKRHPQDQHQLRQSNRSHRSRFGSHGVRFQHARTCRRRSASGQRCRCATPEPFKLLKWHPVLCSLLMWSVRHKQQELGIRASNHDFSITASISLCDFLVHKGYSRTEPPDLALLRRLHGDSSFFHGGQPARPQKSLLIDEERRCYMDNYLGTLGYIPNGQPSLYEWNTEISPHLAPGKNSLVKKGPRTMGSITPVYGAFKSQLGQAEASRRRDWTPEGIMGVVSTSQWVTSFEGEDLIVRPKASEKPTRVHKSPSPTRALKCLGGALHAEAWGASIPYAEILMECKDFLENVRKTAASTFPPHRVPSERHPFRDEWHGRIELPYMCLHLWAINSDGSYDSDFFRPIGEVADEWAKGVGSKSCRRMFTGEETGLPQNKEVEPFLRG